MTTYDVLSDLPPAAADATTRAAAEAGIPRVVTAGDADQLINQAEQFIALIETHLGLTR